MDEIFSFSFFKCLLCINAFAVLSWSWHLVMVLELLVLVLPWPGATWPWSEITASYLFKCRPGSHGNLQKITLNINLWLSTAYIFMPIWTVNKDTETSLWLEKLAFLHCATENQKPTSVDWSSPSLPKSSLSSEDSVSWTHPWRSGHLHGHIASDCGIRPVLFWTLWAHTQLEPLHSDD